MSAKPFVFLLPGMLCDATVWQFQLAALESQFQLAVPVFRGFNNLVAMAHHVLTKAPQRFSLVAHSMGGRVAMELLRLVPERIEHCVLLDMGVHPVTTSETERNQHLFELAVQGGITAVAEHWIPFMIHPSRIGDTELTTTIRRMVMRNTVADLRDQLQAAAERNDQSKYLPFIDHAIHIVCGDADRWNSPALHRQMHESLRNSDFNIIEKCGHMAPMEKPEAINSLLLSWLSPR